MAITPISGLMPGLPLRLAPPIAAPRHVVTKAQAHRFAGQNSMDDRFQSRGKARLAVTGALLFFLRRARWQRQRERAPTRVAATSPLLDMDLDIKQKVDKVTQEETSTQRETWVVMVHAPIRNCKMPMCKIPGLRRLICTCLKDGVEPGKGIRSKDGKCALTINQYAEVLCEGVPVLSRAKTYEISQRLFESAMANPVGTAVVIGTFKKAAEEYHKKLTELGLWTSLEPLEM
eukprot:TRINITY_DN89533_c0_g1_i1.p1 TRINITY_DN89533_c0_g1~~TRINITY_DN89533_c0_g1_i1.p1  ORF type:complete len:232 (-),score=29.25 TRINITY_DN89533_c0_g1_i1:59-754(-)